MENDNTLANLCANYFCLGSYMEYLQEKISLYDLMKIIEEKQAYKHECQMKEFENNKEISLMLSKP